MMVVCSTNIVAWNLLGLIGVVFYRIRSGIYGCNVLLVFVNTSINTENIVYA